MMMMEYCWQGHSVLAQMFRTIFDSHAILNELLFAYGSCHDTVMKHKMEPDERFGPNRGMMGALGYMVPDGFRSWRSITTLEVEVGVTQTWGEYVGSLDWKARTRWSIVPGVEYVLCVHTSSDLTQAEFKLYDFGTNRGSIPVMLPPIPVVAPQTFVELDARHLLGLPRDSTLPMRHPDTNELIIPAAEADTTDFIRFPDPVRIDHYELLAHARAELRDRDAYSL